MQLYAWEMIRSESIRRVMKSSEYFCPRSSYIHTWRTELDWPSLEFHVTRNARLTNSEQSDLKFLIFDLEFGSLQYT